MTFVYFFFNVETISLSYLLFIKVQCQPFIYYLPLISSSFDFSVKNCRVFTRMPSNTKTESLINELKATICSRDLGFSLRPKEKRELSHLAKSKFCSAGSRRKLPV